MRDAEDYERTFDLRWKADMRAIDRWRRANPGKELTLPDHADLVVWLLDKMDAAREALKPFAEFAPKVNEFIDRAASVANDDPRKALMPTKHFRRSHFEKAAEIVRDLTDPPR